MYECDLEDCFRALEYVSKMKLFDISNFDPYKYEFYSEVANGYMTWMLDEKIVAFSTPYDQRFLLKNVF